MITVVIGGSGSGKSAFAENLALELGQDYLVYIATMQPFDKESRKRIERHQRMRQFKKFKTMECFTNLGGIAIPEKATVLLECMSNLVANEMFSDSGAKEKTVEAVKQGVMHLFEKTEHLIIVTNNVFEEGTQYDSTTIEYMKRLGQINQWISAMADQVIEVVHGIPIPIKP